MWLYSDRGRRTTGILRCQAWGHPAPRDPGDTLAWALSGATLLSSQEVPGAVGNCHEWA